MKIASDHASHQGQMTSDVRRRLSTEATYDRTMEQMESVMWPGGKAGAQAVAPAPPVRSYVGPALILTPLLVSGVQLDALLQTPSARDGGHVLPSRPMDVPESARVDDFKVSHDAVSPRNAVPSAMPACLSPNNSADGTVATASARMTRRTRHDADGLATESLVWSPSEHGIEITIRDAARSGPTRRFASEALAQIRRHGLLVRRLTINGATAGEPAMKGETP